VVHLDYVGWIVVMLDNVNRLATVVNFVKHFLNRVGKDEITVYEDARLFLWDCPVVSISWYKKPCEGKVSAERASIFVVKRNAVIAYDPLAFEQADLTKLTMLEGKNADFGIAFTCLKN
jgi:hypothetical protein